MTTRYLILFSMLCLTGCVAGPYSVTRSYAPTRLDACDPLCGLDRPAAQLEANDATLVKDPFLALDP